MIKHRHCWHKIGGFWEGYHTRICCKENTIQKELYESEYDEDFGYISGYYNKWKTEKHSKELWENLLKRVKE